MTSQPRAPSRSRPSCRPLLRSRCSTPVERRRQATREATNPQRLRAANAKLKKRQAARDVLYLYERRDAVSLRRRRVVSHPTHRRRFEVPFAEPCINGDNRPITAPGNCWLEKSMLLPQPATSTRLRHNVERPRANYRRRDGRPLRDLEGLLDLLEGCRAAAFIWMAREGLPVVGPAHVLGRRVPGHAQQLEGSLPRHATLAHDLWCVIHGVWMRMVLFAWLAVTTRAV